MDTGWGDAHAGRQDGMTVQDDDNQLDVFDPEFIRCPFPAYHELRQAAPATYVSSGKGFWLVTDHELVREVVADVETFSSESGPLAATRPTPEALERMAAITPPAGLRGRVDTLLTLDPPGHTRNRKLISRAFTPTAVRRYEDTARRICRELIGQWRDGEEVDFVTAFACGACPKLSPNSNTGNITNQGRCPFMRTNYNLTNLACIFYTTV